MKIHITSRVTEKRRNCGEFRASAHVHLKRDYRLFESNEKSLQERVYASLSRRIAKFVSGRAESRVEI